MFELCACAHSCVCFQVLGLNRILCPFVCMSVIGQLFKRASGSCRSSACNLTDTQRSLLRSFHALKSTVQYSTNEDTLSILMFFDNFSQDLYNNCTLSFTQQNNLNLHIHKKKSFTHKQRHQVHTYVSYIYTYITRSHTNILSQHTLTTKSQHTKENSHN